MSRPEDPAPHVGQEPVEGREQRRLPRAVGADHADHLPLSHAQVKTPNHVTFAVPRMEILQLEEGCGAHGDASPASPT